jgi:hypothetical protein
MISHIIIIARKILKQQVSKVFVAGFIQATPPTALSVRQPKPLCQSSANEASNAPLNVLPEIFNDCISGAKLLVHL